MIDYVAAFFVTITGLVLVIAKVDTTGLHGWSRMLAQSLMFAQAASCIYAGWVLAFW